VFVDLLEQLELSLNKAGLPYMVIGGQAVLLYGEPRLTRDIDITLGVDIDRLEKVLGVASSLNLDILPKNSTEFVTKTKALPAQNQDSGIRVDFIFSNSEYVRQAINRVNSVSIKNAKVKFAAVEDLIIHKIFASRPRDIEDVRGVLLKNQEIDETYIEHWLKEFDQSLGTTLQSTFATVLKEAENN